MFLEGIDTHTSKAKVFNIITPYLPGTLQKPAISNLNGTCGPALIIHKVKQSGKANVKDT